MIFFTQKTCELLQKGGCVSESGFYWGGGGSDREIQLRWQPNIKYDPVLDGTMAFGWWDLCGGSERALENARIVFENGPFENKSSNIFNARHALIDLPEDEVEGYILKSMEGAACQAEK